MTPSEIPYATEQGISKRVSGNSFQGAANFKGAAKSRRVVSVHFSHTCSAGPRTRSVLTAIFVREEGEMSDKPLSRRALRPRRSGERTVRDGAGGCGSAPKTSLASALTP